MEKRNAKRLLGFMTLTALFGGACSDPIVNPPLSLDGPTALAVATGRVCLDVLEAGDGTDIATFSECKQVEGDAPKRGAIGLVTNEFTDRLAFIDLDRTTPRLANLATSTPGVSHLKVGRLPVDVAASPDGTVAYTLNQIDMDISVVNLWEPRELSERIALPDTPIAFDVAPATGELVVALGSPSRLWMRAGATCDSIEACDTGAEDTRQITLPGTVTDLTLSKDGRAFVVYRDLDVVSVVDLASFTITNTIASSFGCDDGIDNDGDGLADKNDPQCYGPFGAEGDDTPGRDLLLDCADGIDNDEDGLIDRNDPDCHSPSASEDSGVAAIGPCNDGFDNDGDGRVDWPADPDCYGPHGRTEAAIERRGFDAIDIDEVDAYVYAIDRARGQIVVFDAGREKIIDAGTAADPSSAAFNDNIGIPTFLTPLDVGATVRRDCLTQDNASSRCSPEFFANYTADTVVVRHSFGAWVSEDTGRLRFIETMDTYCTVPTEDVQNLPDAEFFLNDEARAMSAEANCIAVPAFPLQASDEPFGECVVECGEECDETILSNRFICSDGTNVVVNPRFAFEDVTGSESRVSRGSCDIPTDVSQAMTDFATFAGAPRNFRCDSQLLPQPLQLDAMSLDPNDLSRVDDFARADILQFSYGLTIWDELGNLTNFTGQRRYDERVLAEGWSIEYEGPLPASRRTDGLFDEEVTELDGIEVVRFATGGLDLCAAGAQVGDLLLVKNSPTEECDGFESAFEDFLTYEIVRVDSNSLLVKVIDEDAQDEPRYSLELPTRGCFASGTAYEIRPDDAWIVVGDRSGYVSPLESRNGVCVSRLGDPMDGEVDPSTPTRAARVKTGEVFVGPYLSFWLYPGPNVRGADAEDGELAVAPSRGLRFDFDSNANFTSRSFDTDGVFPSRIVVFQSGGYYRVLSSDSNANFVFYKDARSISTIGARVR